MRKYGFLLIVILITLTGCEEINGVLGLMPKFDTSLPNCISGKFAYFETDAERSSGEYTVLYAFDGRQGTFTRSESGSGVSVKKGTYKVIYRTYGITEANGTIRFTFEDGKSEDSQFYYSATAIGGPDHIILSDQRKYVYWGQ